MRSISGHTRVFALVGDPVAHSLSPTLHNAWFAAHDVDAVYVALRSPAHADVASALETLGLCGANLTVPHKRSVAALLDDLDPAAQAIGAVNTVVRRNDGWHGLNTDGPALVRCLRDLNAPDRTKVVVLGAGGAARAAAWASLRAGATHLVVLNRSVDRARTLLQDLGVAGDAAPLDPHTFRDATRDAGLILNTLPGDARPAVLALPTSQLPASCAWMDLNYWDAAPPHLQALADRGHPVQTGHLMLLHQAALAFQAFTGLDPDLELARSLMAPR